MPMGTIPACRCARITIKIPEVSIERPSLAHAPHLPGRRHPRAGAAQAAALHRRLLPDRDRPDRDPGDPPFLTRQAATPERGMARPASAHDAGGSTPSAVVEHRPSVTALVSHRFNV